jgi:hypothetical protein
VQDLTMMQRFSDGDRMRLTDVDGTERTFVYRDGQLVDADHLVPRREVQAYPSGRGVEVTAPKLAEGLRRTWTFAPDDGTPVVLNGGDALTMTFQSDRLQVEAVVSGDDQRLLLKLARIQPASTRPSGS